MKVKSFILSLKLVLVALIGGAVNSLDTQAFAAVNTPIIDTWSLVESNRSCTLLTIHSWNEKNGQTFYQSGIGWVIQAEDNSYQIITPAHVIHGATRMMAQCKDSNFRLALKASSQSKDVAILKFVLNDQEKSNLVKNKIITPLITFQDYQVYKKRFGAIPDTATNTPDHSRFMNNDWVKSSGFKRWTYSAVVRGQENQPPLAKINDEVFLTAPSVALLSQNKSAAYGGNDLLAIEAFAIRPGFSGTPLIYQNDKAPRGQNSFPLIAGSKYLVGMLIRTDLSGGRSLAITLGDVIKTYLELSKISETEHSQNISDKIEQVDGLQNPVIRYQLKWVGSSLIRFPLLVQAIANSGSFQASEICKDTYQESSDWQVVTNTPLTISPKSDRKDADLMTPYKTEDAKNSSTNKIDSTVLKGGGDYTEGGGGWMAASNTRFKSDTIDSRETTNVSMPIYRTEKTCEVAGLVINSASNFTKYTDPQILIGYIDPQGIGHKVSDLNDLTLELKNKSQEERAQKIAEVYAGAVYKDPKSLDLRPLCQSRLFQGSSKRSFSGLTSMTFKYDKGPETVQKNYGTLSIRENQDNYLACQGSDSFEFSLDQKRMNYVTERKKALSFPATSLKFTVNKSTTIQGQAQVGPDCLITLNEKNVIAANIWKYQIRDKRLKADINLDTKDRLIRFKIFSVAPECHGVGEHFESQEQRPWYSETDIFEEIK